MSRVVVKMMVPFWGTLNIRCRITIGIRNGAIILTTTHIGIYRDITQIMETQMEKNMEHEMGSEGILRLPLVSPGNEGMEQENGNYDDGLYRDYYKDPFLHS